MNMGESPSPERPLSFSDTEDFLKDDYVNNRPSMTISPTKSLHFSNNFEELFITESESKVSDPNESNNNTLLPYNNNTNQIVRNLYSNSTMESFVTANSNVNNELCQSNESSQRHIFASLAGNNSSISTLPQGQTSVLQDSFETPKINSTPQRNFQHESVYDRVNLIRQNTPPLQQSEELLSMGFDTIRQRPSSSTTSFLNEPLIKEPSSPIRAIRMSKIIHDIDITPTQNKPLAPQYELESDISRTTYNKGNDDSLVFDNTINTLAFDNLNISVNNSPIIDNTSVPVNNETTSMESIPNYAYLFITAIHSFNAESLEDKEDIQICLSFSKNDIAFVHVADESGWGEVTLITTQKRGWVPLNYFADVLQPNLYAENPEQDKKSIIQYIDSKLPLEPFLLSCAKLLTFFDKPMISHNTIKIDLINTIRDGVKKLLEITECVSRTNELVKENVSVKKTRKKLLADWYNLMIKADYYKTSHSSRNVATIISLTYEVLKRAISFYESWGKAKLNKFEEDDDELFEDSNNGLNILLSSNTGNTSSTNTKTDSTMLLTPPNAIQRLAEIYDILFSYISIIMGRLDMIEHNPEGCELLEYIVHQMIILLRELLYISKSCSYIIQEKYKYAYESTLDSNLDPLLSLVSELVSCIKVLVTQTLHEDPYTNRSQTSLQTMANEVYRYTAEGKNLIKIVSQMATLIKNVIFGCNSYIRLIGDFQLGNEREYRDFSTIRLTSDEFIERCKKNENEKEKEDTSPVKGKYSKIARFSCIIPNNDNVLNKDSFLINPLEKDEKAFSRSSIFAKFKIDEDEESKLISVESTPVNYKDIIQKEILFDKDGSLIGASFRAFVIKLTDELDKPDDLTVAAFLLYFRQFGNIVDLVNELVARFDIVDKSSQYDIGRKNGSYSSRTSRLKSRRRLVCSIFQKWMESYWNNEDYGILPMMVNFFNEGVSQYLPIESKNLIETASRLFYLLTDNKIKNSSMQEDKKDDLFHQLKQSNIICSRILSVLSEESATSVRSSVFSLDERIIEQYGLTQINPENNQHGNNNNKKNDNIHRESFSLPVLNLGDSSLLSDNDMSKIEKSIGFYETLTETPISSDNKNYDVNEAISNWEYLDHVDIPRNVLLNQFNKPWFALSDLHPLEIARQLTAIESTLFLKIKPVELVHYKNKKFCPNVTAILKFTNQLSNYVMESLCAPQFHLQLRVNRLKCWLRVALSCAYFRNFNSVAGIMTSLQNHSLARLHPLWNSLDKKDSMLFDYLARIVHPNHNFKVYRNKLNAIIKDHQYSKSPVPVVPFFNLYIQDLLFLDEGNPKFRNPDSFRPNKLINTDKYIRMTKIISNLQFFQVGYNHSSLDRIETRNSFFSLSEQLSIDTNFITNIPIVQEFILFEFWRVNKYYEEDSDRGYQQSLSLLPRN